MRIRSRARQKQKSPALMLTPLLDMFTIILIFLMLSFDAENYDFRTHPDLQLPESKARTKLRPGVNVQLARTGVFVGEMLAFPLENGRFTDEQRARAKADELVKALETERNARENEFEGNKPIIVMQADKDTRYIDLYVVLHSAASAGFFEYRLAAARD